MKKVVVSTLAVLLACPAFAGMHRANQDTWQLWGMDPYIALRGGASYTDMKYRFNDSKKSVTDHAFQGRAALGLEVCDTARAEVEWSIFSKMKDTKDFGDIQNVKVDTKMQNLLFNMYWEFGGYQIVRPFIGLGAGVGFADVKRHVPELGSHSDSKTRVAADGSLGVTFDMKRFAVDIAARYTYVDIQSGFHNIGGDVGIRFMF